MANARTYIAAPIVEHPVSRELGFDAARGIILADIASRYQRLFGVPSTLLVGIHDRLHHSGNDPTVDSLCAPEATEEDCRQVRQVLRSLHVGEHELRWVSALRRCPQIGQQLRQLERERSVYSEVREYWWRAADNTYFFSTWLDDIEDWVPEHSQVPVRLWYLRAQQFVEQLEAHLRSHPHFIAPRSRYFKVLERLQQPVSEAQLNQPAGRPASFIHPPVEYDQTPGFWLECVLPYLAGAEAVAPFGSSDQREAWSRTQQLVHWFPWKAYTIRWPALLLALGQPLPKRVVVLNCDRLIGEGHGNEGLDVVHPGLRELVSAIGIEPVRYLIARRAALDGSGEFTLIDAQRLVTKELVNHLGNLLQRTTALVVRRFQGSVPRRTEQIDGDSNQLLGSIPVLVAEVRDRVEHWEIAAALSLIAGVVKQANRYITRRAPWETVRVDRDHAAITLRIVWEVLRVAGILLQPVLPVFSERLLHRIGCQLPTWEGIVASSSPNPITIEHGEPLFRVEGRAGSQP